MRLLARQSALWLAVFMVGCGGASGPQYLRQGIAALQKQEYDTAISLLVKATERMPRSAEAYNYLGAAYQGKGDQTRAVRAFEKSVALDGEYPPARFNLGVLYHERGQFEKAVEQLAKFVALQPDHVDGFFYLASAQFQLDDLPNAQINYLEVLKRDPTRPEVLNNLGIISAKLGAPSREAETMFLECIKTDPQYSPAYLNLAILYHRTLGKPAAALDYYEQFLALEPAGPSSETARAALAELKSAKTAAARPAEPPPKPATPKPAEPPPLVVEPAPTTAPTPPPPPAPPHSTTPPPETPSVASAEPAPVPSAATLTGPRYPKPSFPKPSAGKRDAALVEFNRGAQYQRDKLLDAAIFCYRQALKLDPTLVEAQYNLGTALHAQGMANQAIEAYLRALELQPGFANARLNLAILFELKGYLPDAAEQYETLLRESPDNPTFHLALGRLYSKQPQTAARARRHYQRFVELAPDSPDAPRVAQWLKDNPAGPSPAKTKSAP